MTSIAHAPTDSRSLRRALRLDLRLNAGMFATTVVLSVAALVVAAFWSGGMAGLATAWAALALCRYGRRDTAENATLRAGLGISRAHALRGRLALVGIEGTILVVVAAVGAAWRIGQGDSPQGAFSIQGLGDAAEPGAGHVLLAALLTVILSASALVVSMLPVGRECLTRRPGSSMYLLSLLSFAGSSLLIGIIDVGILWLAQVTLHSSGLSPQSELLGVLGLGVVGNAAILLLALAVLRRRSRRWIHELDSAGR